MVENKVSIRVSPKYKDIMMSKEKGGCLRLFLDSHKEREVNPPNIDEMFVELVIFYRDALVFGRDKAAEEEDGRHR